MADEAESKPKPSGGLGKTLAVVFTAVVAPVLVAVGVKHLSPKDPTPAATLHVIPDTKPGGSVPDPTPIPPPPPPPPVKPDLHFTMRVFGPARPNGPANPPPPYTVGEAVQFQAVVPAGSHAALILASEAGEVEVLATFHQEAQARHVDYPLDNKGKPGRQDLVPPTGTHVILLAASPGRPITPEQLGLREGEAWAALPEGALIEVNKGRAAVIEAGGRGLGGVKAVRDPVEDVRARLNQLLRAAPADVTVEGVAFAVKPR